MVVLDPSLMLVTDVILCEDGHAQERSLLDQVLELVRAKDVWIDDRNFCTTSFLFGIARREAFFVVRQHAATLHWEFTGKKRACGRIETGKVFEQTVRLSNPDTGEILFARRITVALDKPTRDGDGEIHILTNLPKKAARAKTVADLYRKRWTIETAFQELEATLDGEINTLGYPKAALFAFCVALVSYNLMSVIKAALRTVHGADRRREGVGVLPGQRGYDDSQGNDDRDSGGRMGRVPEIDSGRDGRGLDRSGAERAIGFVPQAASRP